MKNEWKGLLDLAQYEAELVKIPRKPPAQNHPWRKGLPNSPRNLKWNELTEERNSRWLNDWKSLQNTSILWTKQFYSLSQLEEYGYRVDKDDSKAEGTATDYKPKRSIL